jgi:hypothetical protein
MESVNCGGACVYGVVESCEILRSCRTLKNHGGMYAVLWSHVESQVSRESLIAIYGLIEFC